MASRLSTLPSRVSALKPRIERLTDASGHGPDDQLRRLYHTARWKRLRLATFERDLYTCKRCGRAEGDTSRLVCDHVQRHAHRNEAMFWNPDNLQTLCTVCHSRHKQIQEARERALGL